MGSEPGELRIAELKGGTLSYLDEGAGPAVVLLHGIGSAARSWGAQVEALSKRRRVIAWNAPGYPPSATLTHDWPSAADYALRLASLLEHLDVRACHLVGHSLGCLIAARFTLLDPSRVLSLTLASCALGHARLPEAERERLLASRIGDIETLGPRRMAEKRGPRLLGPGASAEAVRSVVDTMARVDPRGYAQATRMLSRGDLIADIEALPPALPVQFVYGGCDVITPPEVNLRAASARPDAPVTVIETAGHACYVEQSQRFNCVIEEFSKDHG
jgi:pimeloyl-ACP methyl ester carboxylesterase